MEVNRTTETSSQDFANEKKVNIQQTVHEDVESDGGLEKPVWNPGFLARFPTVGALALFTALICAVSAVVVLKLSNEKSQTHWSRKIAPNVILSGLNSVANIAVAVAIGNGIAIAWWRQVLKGATIKELHRSWSFSTSMLELLFSARYLNVIAFTALITKLSIVDNMLLQRATGTYPSFDAMTINHGLNFTLVQEFPITGRTGIASDNTASVLTPPMAYNLAIWQQSGAKYVTNVGTGCRGQCDVGIPAIGLEIECEDIVTESINAFDSTDAVTLFNISFEMATGPFNGNGAESAFIKMYNVWTYADDNPNGATTGRADPSQNISSGCPGTRSTRQCNLYPAIVNYTSSIEELGTNTDIQSATYQPPTVTALNYDVDNELIGYNQTTKQLNGNLPLHRTLVPPRENGTTDTRLGGIKLALDMYMAGQAVLRNASYADGFELQQNGTAATYLTNVPDNYQCGYQFTAPIKDYGNTATSADFRTISNDILVNLNNMMFALAINASLTYFNTDYYIGSHAVARPFEITTLTGQEYREAIFYTTNEAFMWGAFASMLVCILLVLPSYWGYWQLGRKVSLGPFEIAHAFRSPMTAPSPEDPAAVAKTNGTVSELMEAVGDRQVKYGQIVQGDARGMLGVAEPECVSRVHPKIGSARAEISELFHPHVHRKESE